MGGEYKTYYGQSAAVKNENKYTKISGCDIQFTNKTEELYLDYDCIEWETFFCA